MIYLRVVQIEERFIKINKYLCGEMWGCVCDYKMCVTVFSCWWCCVDVCGGREVCCV